MATLKTPVRIITFGRFSITIINLYNATYAIYNFGCELMVTLIKISSNQLINNICFQAEDHVLHLTNTHRPPHLKLPTQ